MKRIKVISLFLICVLMLPGCNSKTTSGIKYNDEINCSILNDVKMVFNQSSANIIVLTNGGDLYKFGNYSDGTNCKKMNNDVKVIKTIDNRSFYPYIVDSNKNMFELDDDELEKYKLCILFKGRWENIFCRII